MSRALFFFAGFILAIGLSGRAVEIEGAIGRSEFCCLTDSLWWQSQFGFNGSTRSKTWELGVRQRFGNWGIAGRYADLGESTGQNVATMRDDDFGKFNPTQPCNTSTQQNCLGYFAVAQHVKAVMLGASYLFTWRGIGIEPEVGQAFYQSNMRVQILCPNCGVGNKYAFGAGGTFSSTSEVRRSPYGSLRIVYRGMTLTYRRISNVDGNGEMRDGEDGQFATGLTHGPVNQILVGVTL